MRRITPEPTPNESYKMLKVAIIILLGAIMLCGAVIAGMFLQEKTAKNKNTEQQISTEKVELTEQSSFDTEYEHYDNEPVLEEENIEAFSNETTTQQNEEETIKINEQQEQTFYRVRKSADDADSQIGAFSDFENARNLADEKSTEGYAVYDENGNLIYQP